MERPNEEMVIEELIVLLNEEITSLNNGSLDRVVDLYDQKTELLKIMEVASPTIEKQIRSETNKATGLRENLAKLYTLVRKNAKMLENMTEATREVIDEIARIRDRHGLGGLYKPDGEKQPKVASFTQGIDQSL